MKKKCCWINYIWVIIQNQIVILDLKNVKLVLDLSNYATNKKLEHITDVNTSDLAAKKDFLALKAEVHKLGIN